MTAASPWLAAAHAIYPAGEPSLMGKADTPGALARRLDTNTVQTPALTLIDSEMVQVRDAVAVMFARRARFAELVNVADRSLLSETEVEQITGQVVNEIPDNGNTRLALSMPPQEGKTERIGRRGTLWLLLQFPTLRIGIVSYDGDHASRISYMVRSDIELFDGTGGNPDLGLRLAKDQKAMSRWLLTSGGSCYAIGIGGGITGRPLDLLIIDDPVKDIRAADSILLSKQAWDWWQTAARPRLAPWAPVIVVATRWHELDLIGRIILSQREAEQSGVEHYDRWHVVSIPAQADHRPEDGETDILGRQPGEFMVSARGRTREQWERTKNGTAPRFWLALYQARPAPQEGNIWLETWWRYYTEALWSQQPNGSFRLIGFDRVIASWDMSFKDTATSDFVAGQVWAKRGAEAFLIYQVWARLGFPDAKDAVNRVHRLFPQAAPILIEDTANGPAIIASLKNTVPGIVAVKVGQSNKTARAEAVSPFIRAGNVWLPGRTLDGVSVAALHPELGWSPADFVSETKEFPNGANDDQVDAASQALAELFLGASGEGAILAAKGRIPERAPSGGVRAGTVQQRLTDRQLRRR